MMIHFQNFPPDIFFQADFVPGEFFAAFQSKTTIFDDAEEMPACSNNATCKPARRLDCSLQIS
jgi:hypothetical protein